MVALHRRRCTAAAGGLALAALAAGCGSSSSAAPTTTSQSKAKPAAATTTTAAPRTTTVHIMGFKYVPATITVRRGARVTWVNEDVANHTVTSDAGSVPKIRNLDHGARASVRFTKPGTYAYHCDFHPFMHGRVVVR